MEHNELLAYSPSIKAEAERVKIKDDFTGNTMLQIMINAAKRERERCKKIVNMNCMPYGEQRIDGDIIGHYNTRMLAQIDSGFDPDDVTA